MIENRFNIVRLIKWLELQRLTTIELDKKNENLLKNWKKKQEKKETFYTFSRILKNGMNGDCDDFSTLIIGNNKMKKNINLLFFVKNNDKNKTYAYHIATIIDDFLFDPWKSRKKIFVNLDKKEGKKLIKKIYNNDILRYKMKNKIKVESL